MLCLILQNYATQEPGLILENMSQNILRCLVAIMHPETENVKTLLKTKLNLWRYIAKKWTFIRIIWR